MSNTVGQVIAQATATLSAAQVDSPKLAAQVLLAHALGRPRASVAAAPPGQALQPHQLAAFHALVARCAGGEPLAYVVGHAEFYGLDFISDRRALIPRPETEHLVELVLAHIQSQPGARAAVVDVGTGTGCIVVSLAVKRPDMRLMATDISSDALALAQENARRHDVSARIQFLRGDLLAPVLAPVDGVIANLPYVTTAEWQALPRNIRDHEPRAALDGGADGLDLIRKLLAQAGQRVKPDGWLLLEIGASQGPAVTALARRTFPMAGVNLHRDYAGLARVMEVQLCSAPGSGTG